MARMKAALPLFTLCCLLAVIAGVSAGSNRDDHHRFRGRFEMSHRRHGRPIWHRPHHHHHRRFRVRVRTACHGRTLRLGCHRGYQIRVLDAFYGRASGRICPKLRFKHGHRQRNSHVTRCSAKSSRAKASRLCQGKRHCRLEASGKIFGKPCSSKERAYLRVRYTCVFQACRRVVWLQAKLVQLIGRYGRLAKHSYGYWRRKHFRHRRLRLKRKLNRLRRRFHFCFKCRGFASVVLSLLLTVAVATGPYEVVSCNQRASQDLTGPGACQSCCVGDFKACRQALGCSARDWRCSQSCWEARKYCEFQCEM